jgi:hypothetical protein
MAITNGTSVSIISAPQLPGQTDAVIPVLQAQDGSFVGEYGVWQDSTDDYMYTMVAFDATGNVGWMVPNERPQIATDDGGVIGQSGITYDQNGSTTGQMNLAIYSWLGNAYQVGSTDQVLSPPPRLGATSTQYRDATASGNRTAIKHVPTTLVISKKLGVIQDCYSSLGDNGASYAERDITYNVADQYKQRMSGGMQIQERLLPGSDSPCPNGTTWQGGACVSPWINKLDEFADMLLANPGTGHSEYIQGFWVATPANRPGYAAFYGQIQIDAYKKNPSAATSLTETKFVIDVNGNTGMNASGTPIRRCK